MGCLGRLRSRDSCEGSSRSRPEGPSLPLQVMRTQARSDCGHRGPGPPRGHLPGVLGSPGPNTGLISQERQRGTQSSFVCSFIHSFSKHLSLGTTHCLGSKSAPVSWDSEGGPEKYLKECLLRECILDSPPRPSAEVGTISFFLSCHSFSSGPPSVHLYIKEARL